MVICVQWSHRFKCSKSSTSSFLLTSGSSSRICLKVSILALRSGISEEGKKEEEMERREGGRETKKMRCQFGLLIVANVHTCSINKLLMTFEGEQWFSKLFPEVSFHCTCQCLCVPLVHITEVQLINLSSLNAVPYEFVCL